MIAQNVSLSARPGRGVSLALAVMAVAALSTVGRAAIAGFGDFSGFAINQNDTGAPPTVSIPAGAITLTNTGSGEARSIFATTPQAIGAFTASFTYKASINYFVLTYQEQGMAFVLQTSPSGSAATGGSGSGVGYAQAIFVSIVMSVITILLTREFVRPTERHSSPDAITGVPTQSRVASPGGNDVQDERSTRSLGGH